jgi:hypothetical protein
MRFGAAEGGATDRCRIVTVTGNRMKDAQRRFEIRLRVWASERIWPVGGLLDYQEQEHMAERRAAELIQLATEMGFEDSLTGKVMPYGSVVAYVQQLMRKADFRAAQSHDSKKVADA